MVVVAFKTKTKTLRGFFLLLAAVCSMYMGDGRVIYEKEHLN